MEDGKPLIRFPRIWILGLSKADLLPDLNVFGFRDLVIGKASDDLGELRKVLEGLVESPDALAVGEDFLLLSSAKFEPNRIDVTERKGLDLVLPVAAMLPFERHIKWIERQQLAVKVVEELLSGLGALATAFIGKGKVVRLAKAVDIKKRLMTLLDRKVMDAAIVAVSSLGLDELRKMHDEAVAKQDYMAAVLTRFKLDLHAGEEDGVLLTSRK